MAIVVLTVIHLLTAVLCDDSLAVSMATQKLPAVANQMGDVANISRPTNAPTNESTDLLTTRTPVNVKTVCYDHVGCFSNAPPFDNAGLVLPKSPEDIGTRFFLYTREGQLGNDTSIVDYVNASALRNTHFETSRLTKFIIHGFDNDNTTEWLYEMKEELLKNMVDCNVLIVAWGPGAVFPEYAQAVANTRVVAEQVKMMITNMVTLGATYNSMHLIGHSLGAHISGHAGQLLRKQNLNLGRITGLDPAEPDYKDHPKVVRLDKNDATFVDVIHTNGAPVLKGGAGLFEPCGDVDFYVNGGEKQPDCPSQISEAFKHLGDLFSGNTAALSTAISCSHSRAHDVFTESINSNTCHFTSYPCDGYGKFQNGECLSCGDQNCGIMGYDWDTLYSTGMMFLNTRHSQPFCGHHYGVAVHVSDNTKGKVMIQLNGRWSVSEWLTVTRSDSASLKHGATLNRVVVAGQIIGQITSINVKYVKAGGYLFGFGAGKKNLNLFQISLHDGENGIRYVFCFNKPLHTDKITTITASGLKSCQDKL